MALVTGIYFEVQCIPPWALSSHICLHLCNFISNAHLDTVHLLTLHFPPFFISGGGIQVYKIVKEGLKDQPTLLKPNENKKPEVTAAMEEMQARMEKMQEDMNIIKQQSKISMGSAKGSEPLKGFPDEPIKGSALLKTDPKRVFIRSRL